jgi:hypothetical protein
VARPSRDVALLFCTAGIPPLRVVAHSCRRSWPCVRSNHCSRCSRRQRAGIQRVWRRGGRQRHDCRGCCQGKVSLLHQTLHASAASAMSQPPLTHPGRYLVSTLQKSIGAAPFGPSPTNGSNPPLCASFGALMPPAAPSWTTPKQSECWASLLDTTMRLSASRWFCRRCCPSLPTHVCRYVPTLMASAYPTGAAEFT